MMRSMFGMVFTFAFAAPAIVGCASADRAMGDDGPIMSGAQAISEAMPVHTGATLMINGTASDCDRSGAVQVDGSLAIAGMNAHFTFSNNTKGTKTATSDTSIAVSLLSAGSQITLPKQPSRGGVGGNPYIWVQLVDGNGAALSGEMYMGRCKDGLSSASASTFLDTAVSLDVTGDVCSGKGGSSLSVSGTMTLPSVHAKMIFRNAPNGPHEATATSTDDVAIVIEGTGIDLPKSPVKGGAGGNPLVSMQLFDASGGTLSSSLDLGRCSTL